MNRISLVLAVLCFLSIDVAFAKTGSFEQIQISPIHSIEDAYFATEKNFVGQICFRKTPTSANHHECGTLAEIQASHKIRFFYPDLQTEVTEDVSLEELEQLEFSYTAEIVQELPPPTFYIVAELLNEDLIEDVALEKSLEIEIASYFGNPPSALVQQLNAVRASLMNDYPAAVYEWPYAKSQLNNPPIRYTTHNKNYRLQVHLDRSDYFQGETGKVTYKLKSLRPGAQPQDIYYFGADGRETYSSNVKSNYFEISSTIYPMFDDESGIKPLEFRTSTAGRTFHYTTVPFVIDVPFMMEGTAPQVFNPFFFAVGDYITVDMAKEIGRLNLASFEAKILQHQENAEPIEIESKLYGMDNNLTHAKNGIKAAQTARLESLSNELPEGAYDVILNGYDFSGNHINENVTVFIDSTPPEIVVSHEDGHVTDQSEFVVNISAVDPIQGQLIISKDGVELWNFFGSGDDFTLSLEEGPNTYTIEAIDQGGNSSVIEWTVILETAN